MNFEKIVIELVVDGRNTDRIMKRIGEFLDEGLHAHQLIDYSTRAIDAVVAGE